MALKTHQIAIPTTKKTKRLCKQNLSLAKNDTSSNEKSVVVEPSCSKKSDAISQKIEDVMKAIDLTQKSVKQELNLEIDANLQWEHITGNNLKEFPITIKDAGIPVDVAESMSNKLPIDFFNLFVDNELLQLITEETNKYAAQRLKKQPFTPNSRMLKWKNTSLEEMKIFLGIQVWMGLVQMPKTACYWSSSFLYSNEIKMVLSRNRFELIRANWHFADNESSIEPDLLYKLSPLIKHINKKFQKMFVPNKNMCINETSILFRGHLSFLQYVKNKSHTFNLKLSKLQVDDGYTYCVKICSGKENLSSENIPTNIVLELCNNLLDCGRTLYVDKYYTSLELAHKLLSKKTHLVGILDKNKKGNPKALIQKDVNNLEIIGKESNTGVVIIKWYDKKETLMLSTKHTESVAKVPSKRNVKIEKPQAVIDYNQAFEDLTDSSIGYSNCLKRGLKWYRKIAVELLLGSAMVNAFLLYKKIVGNQLSITNFREEVAKSLIKSKSCSNPLDTKDRHFLLDLGTSCRRRCTECYKQMSQRHGRIYASKKTFRSKYKCSSCDKYYCVTCFTEVHYCTI